MLTSIAWTDLHTVRILDQTRLPEEEVYLTCRDFTSLFEAIRSLQIRGAPAIGVAAAAAVALGAHTLTTRAWSEFRTQLHALAERLAQARPTAVNLQWAITRMLRTAEKNRDLPLDQLQERLVREAQTILEEDIAVNQALGGQGRALIPDGARILTHCNAGALATAGYGTALGVIRAAVAEGKRISVIATETRPVLQGARLTAWELQRDGIPVTLITDGAAGLLMALRRADLVLVGADRIAANGDVANKIGTYTLAVLAAEHHLPFYVAAPRSSLDLTRESGHAIPIEERDPREVTHLGGRSVTPTGIPAWNPAFDITPARYVSAIITERGVAYPPYAHSLRQLVPESSAG